MCIRDSSSSSCPPAPLCPSHPLRALPPPSLFFLPSSLHRLLLASPPRYRRHAHVGAQLQPEGVASLGPAEGDRGRGGHRSQRCCRACRAGRRTPARGAARRRARASANGPGPIPTLDSHTRCRLSESLFLPMLHAPPAPALKAREQEGVPALCVSSGESERDRQERSAELEERSHGGPGGLPACLHM
eukprot:264801-Rhodomonas_salina.1